MAATDSQLLYGLGPFGGMKFGRPGVFVPVRPMTDGPSDAYFTSFIDTQRFHMAATGGYGRTEFIQFPNLIGIEGLIRYDVDSIRPYWIAQDSAGRLNYYDLKNNLITDLGVQGTPFTEGFQCDGNIFLNNGMQIYVTPDADYPGMPKQSLAITQWQFPKFAGTPTLEDVSVPPEDELAPQTYYYAFTVVTTITTINGSIKQESAPIGADAPYPYHKQIHQSDEPAAIQISGLGGGTNDDGTTYAIRIYRQSTNQPIWFEVTTTQAATYIDTATDQSISGNAQLPFSGQQPPVGSGKTWPVAEYLDRGWVFAVVQNAATQQQPQTQLWYSNVGQTWNFDDVAQVLLVGNEATTPAQTHVDYAVPYGEQPVSLTKFGSLLIAQREGDSWFVTGQDQNTFQVITLFDSVGSIAPNGGVVGRGIWAWLADSGFWTFDGTNLNYISDDIWELLLTFTPGTQTTAVGFYWQNYFCWSFPANNITLCWHAPTQQWSTLPYALSNASALRSVGSNPANVTGSAPFNQVVGVRPGTNILDSWFSDPIFDLGLPVESDWQGPASDVSTPAFTKTVSYLLVEAPPQPGSCTVTLHRNLDQPTKTGQYKPYTATFDLSVPYPNLQKVPQEYQECTMLSLEVKFQPTVGATSPVQIWKAEAYGKIQREYALRV